jgi:hypothetical protein
MLFTRNHGDVECTARPARMAGQSMSGPPRQGDVKHSLADLTRAGKYLGYQPTVSFEEGLRQTVDWYRTVEVESRELIVFDWPTGSLSPTALEQRVQSAIY